MLLSDTTVDRRLLLGGAAALGLTVGMPGASAATPRPRLDYPFTLGIASGDPDSFSIVLWTRLAPRPFDPDWGMRGIRQVPVRWRVAEDAQMRHVVARGTAVADKEWAHSVHVEVKGLRPGREYHYQFEAAGHLSARGRTKTAPADDATRQILRDLAGHQ